MDSAMGAIDRRRNFLDFNDAQVWPDGMAVDDEGMLWIAPGRSGAVHRYRPDGTLDGIVELPTTNPTSVAFGGSDGGDLYITTSWSDVEPERRAAQPTAGAIFRCRPGVTGRPHRDTRPPPARLRGRKVRRRRRERRARAMIGP
jgi:sugar lactone lactonase YvrE